MGGASADALCVAGYTSAGSISQCERFDGSVWSVSTSYPVSTYSNAGVGTAGNSVTIMGGPTSANCFFYNGSAWVAIATMTYARDEFGAGGIASSICAHGGDGSTGLTTELYS